MGLWENLKRPFRRKMTKEWIRAGALRSTTPNPRAHDHFRGGNLDVSNNELITEAERARLRAWCKKEYLDNPYARNAARNFALGVYGTGPSLQVMTQDEALNTKIEAIFRTWRKKTQLDWKFHVALNSLFYDGEAFFYFFHTPTIPGGLNVELIESRRVREPYDGHWDVNRLEGITYNEFNEPVLYCVQKETINPMFGRPEEFTMVPADFMLHFFLDDVVNQKRGLPLLQSVLQTLAGLQRISQASLNAWELAAKMNLIVQTGMDAYEFLRCVPKGYDEDSEALVEAFKTIPVPEDGGMTFLASGMSVNQVKNEHPNSQFHENKMTYLSEIGAGVGEPRNIITGDSSSYNFSSAQLDNQFFTRWGGAVQGKIQTLLNRILTVSLVSHATQYPEIQQLAQICDLENIPAEWFFPNVLEGIDRMNNAGSEVALLQSGLMTHWEYCKRHGLDYEKHIAQLKREKELLQTTQNQQDTTQQENPHNAHQRPRP